MQIGQNMSANTCLVDANRASAWVTGAHGFIGRHLCRYLAGLGYAVCGLGHGLWPATDARAWGVLNWVNGDISASNLEHMRQKFGAPEFVFHLAGGSSVGLAISNPFEDFRRTVGSTAELLEWIRQHASMARLVAVSSAAVYGAMHQGPIAETAQVKPFSPYGTHKFVMEELCRSYGANFGLQIAIPRLFSVYGAGLQKQLLWDLCGKLQLSTVVELGGSGEELRDWIDVRDVARGLERVAHCASTQTPIVNLGSGFGTSVKDIARMTQRSWAGEKEQLPALGFNGCSRVGDPFSLVADVGRMQALGVESTIPFEQGVADYVSWYRARMKEGI